MWRRVTNVRFLGVYVKEDLIPESTAETLLPECPQEEEHPSETVGFLLQLYRQHFNILLPHGVSLLCGGTEKGPEGYQCYQGLK